MLLSEAICHQKLIRAGGFFPRKTWLVVGRRLIQLRATGSDSGTGFRLLSWYLTDGCKVLSIGGLDEDACHTQLLQEGSKPESEVMEKLPKWLMQARAAHTKLLSSWWSVGKGGAQSKALHPGFGQRALPWRPLLTRWVRAPRNLS